ncbi:MAG: indole-3-glycerol phosphate synthase TrpC [Candidatus Marinimicrobia bacterium]|nr:indole-3-glycerol phosphate synthase TrpC [Candidatus Neomarinimicrobiota bacterium]
MTSIISQILHNKRQEVANLEKKLPMSELMEMERVNPLISFHDFLARPGVQIIAEIKPKSPSLGELKKDFDLIGFIEAYEKNGAAAISVLTDEMYFGGSLDILKQVKSNTQLPVLRKDFIITEYQVWESYVAGADAILLIADALPLDRLISLHDLAEDLGLAVLVEIYEQNHAHLFQSFNPNIAGVNARNLHTLKTDLDRCLTMVDLLPQKSIKVAESGISSREDIIKIAHTGFDAALVGSSLMSAPDPGKKLAELTSRAEA